VTDPDTPEGLVALADGHLLVADQATDRIVVMRPPSTTRVTFLQLTPRPGVEGVDGLGIDASRGLLLVPDSAQGRLLTVPLTGGAPTVVVSGLGRAVGAAVSPDGSYAVAVEASAGLVLVKPASGAAHVVADIGQTDDVIASGSLLYAAALDAHAILAIDPGTDHHRVLVKDVQIPQGLADDTANTLVVTDSASGAVSLAFTC